MMVANNNKALSAANKARQDEFYTQLSDIENELQHYKPHFKGKTVLCNCDDPHRSNFFRYFAVNFNRLGLKKLICSCYADLSAAEAQSGTKPCKIEITAVKDLSSADAGLADTDLILSAVNGQPTPLQGDGDFRSEECIALLKEADIVVTNPPFSLFREYVAQLIEYGRKFLILGSQNAMTYKEIFPLLKDNRMWTGYKSGDMEFTVPDSYEARETRFRIDETGQKWRSFGNICWYTNLDTDKRHKQIKLCRSYDPGKYPRYDNFDAIEVSRTADIPFDYDGVMGVPITFMDKYSPEQFEIVGNEYSLGIGRGRGYINGRRMYSRVFIRRRK